MDVLDLDRGERGLGDGVIEARSDLARLAPVHHPGHACPGVLTILATHQPDTNPEITALTLAEIRRLLNAFVLAFLTILATHTLHWSIWRRTSGWNFFGRASGSRL